MHRWLMGAAIAALATTSSSAAVLHLQVFDGATLILNLVSGSGSLSAATTDANFSIIAVDATGAPLVPNADLSSVVLEVKSASAGSHVLTVDLFQTGVSAPAGSRTLSTFSSNDLIGDPGPTIETTYFNGTGSTLGTPLATHTFAVGDPVDHFGPVSTVLSAPLFADAHRYATLFTSAGQSSNDTIQLSTAIPETSTWAMTLGGFAMLAFLGWRKSLLWA